VARKGVKRERFRLLRFVGQQLMVKFESSWAVAESGARVWAWARASLESGRAEPSRAESRVEPGFETPRGFVLGSDFRMSV
jgi:hypothetical protein